MATIDRPTIIPMFSSEDFWSWAVIWAPMLALAVTWSFSTYFQVLEGLPLVDVEVSPLQALVIGSYTMSPVAAGLYAYGEWCAACARATKTWPTVPGVVNKSLVVKSYVYKRGTVYRLETDYRYTVNGEEHYGDRVQYGSKWLDSEEFVNKLAEKYPVGAAVTVHYQPDNPNEAVLDTSDEATKTYCSDYFYRAHFLMGVIAFFPLAVMVHAWIHGY